jgi:hypothetical protein
MDRIGRRPSLLRPPPSAPQAARSTATNQAAPAATVDTVHRSSFEAPVTKAAAAAASQPMPGAWRGGPDTPVGKAIAGMMERLRGSDAAGIKLKGDTIESLFTRAILENKHVTNEQFLAMGQVKLEDLATSPADRAKVLKKVPNARELPVHKFTVAMLAAATGLDPKQLSEVCPDLGLTGAPGTPLLYAAKTERMQRSTALHDFTDYLRGAGLKGLNKAVWGVEDRILSAAVSALGGGRY